MKKLIFLLIFNTISYSQDINGIYQSRYTSFNNPNDTSSNFFKQEYNSIIIDIYDFPNPNGSVTIMSKDKNGDAFSVKYQVIGERTTEKSDTGIYFIYPAKIYLYNHPTKTNCSIAIHSNLDDLIILYDDTGSSQLFDLKK